MAALVELAEAALEELLVLVKLLVKLILVVAVAEELTMEVTTLTTQQMVALE